jgi:hypothetical protein
MPVGRFSFLTIRETFERCEARWVPLEPGISCELVRVKVYFVDDVTLSTFFHSALSEEFRPFVVGGRRVLNKLPESVIVMRGNERYAEDACRHKSPVKPTRQGRPARPDANFGCATSSSADEVSRCTEIP